MAKRYETHTNYGKENEENYDDGIIDTKEGNAYICNWQYITNLLNDCEETISRLLAEKEHLEEINKKQEEKINKLEELLMIRKIQKKEDEKGC